MFGVAGQLTLRELPSLTRKKSENTDEVVNWMLTKLDATAVYNIIDANLMANRRGKVSAHGRPYYPSRCRHVGHWATRSGIECAGGSSCSLSPAAHHAGGAIRIKVTHRSVFEAILHFQFKKFSYSYLHAVKRRKLDLVIWITHFSSKTHSPSHPAPP